MHDGEHAGIGSPPSQVKFDIHAFKGLLERARNQAAGPLIEITHQQTGMLKPGRSQDLAAHEHLRLSAALEVASPQMNIEQMHHLARGNLQVAADATTRLAT